MKGSGGCQRFLTVACVCDAGCQLEWDLLIEVTPVISCFNNEDWHHLKLTPRQLLTTLPQ